MEAEAASLMAMLSPSSVSSWFVGRKRRNCVEFANIHAPPAPAAPAAPAASRREGNVRHRRGWIGAAGAGPTWNNPDKQLSDLSLLALEASPSRSGFEVPLPSLVSPPGTRLRPPSSQRLGDASHGAPPPAGPPSPRRVRSGAGGAQRTLAGWLGSWSELPLDSAGSRNLGWWLGCWVSATEPRAGWCQAEAA